MLRWDRYENESLVAFIRAGRDSGLFRSVKSTEYISRYSADTNRLDRKWTTSYEDWRSFEIMTRLVKLDLFASVVDMMVDQTTHFGDVRPSLQCGPHGDLA